LEDFPKAKPILDGIVQAAAKGERTVIQSTRIVE